MIMQTVTSTITQFIQLLFQNIVYIRQRYTQINLNCIYGKIKCELRESNCEVINSGMPEMK